MRIRSSAPLHVALLGYGVLGRAVAQKLTQHQGQPLVLHTIYEKDAQQISIPAGVRLAKSYHDVVMNPAIDVVIDTLEGTHPAFDAVHTALCQAKHVMTANTTLMAAYGQSLCETARVQNVHLGCEGALFGGLGLNRWLQNVDGIKSFYIQVDDAANRVFERMESTAETLNEASAKLGEQTMAEMNLSARELMFKAATLQAFTWGMWTNTKLLHPKGVDQVTPELVRMAIRMGYRIRLVAQVQADGLSVGPQMVPQNSPLAQLNGVQISTETEDGSFYLQGQQPMLASALTGLMQDIRSLTTRQPALRVPQQNRAYQKEEAQDKRFVVALPSGMAERIRADSRVSLMVEEVDTRTQHVGALVQTPMRARDLQQVVGTQSALLPLMQQTEESQSLSSF